MSMWDIVQQAQMRGLVRSQGMAESDALARTRRQDDRTDKIEDQLAKVTDLIEAIWDVLSDRVGVSDDALADAVTAVLTRREAAKQPLKCFRCGATMLRAEFRCQFCGAERPPDAPPAPPTTF
jgi:hypothetical protein